MSTEPKLKKTRIPKSKTTKRERTHDVSLVKLALVMINNIRARRHVWRNQNVRPIISPSGIVLVVVWCCRCPLKPLGIILFFPHFWSSSFFWLLLSLFFLKQQDFYRRENGEKIYADLLSTSEQRLPKSIDSLSY